MDMGYPVELETDCQALRIICSVPPQFDSCQVRDAVLAHNIVDVRHRPGRLNVVMMG